MRRREDWPPKRSTFDRTCAPGVTTEALDSLVFDFAMAHGAYPAPLDYRGYRKSICTSLNMSFATECPIANRSRRRYRQYRRYLDPRRLAWRFEPDVPCCDVPAAQRLVEVTYESLMRGMAAVRRCNDGDIAPPSKTMPSPNAVPSCATFAAMALAASSRRTQHSPLCRRGEGVQLKPACSSRSSR